MGALSPVNLMDVSSLPSSCPCAAAKGLDDHPSFRSGEGPWRLSLEKLPVEV